MATQLTNNQILLKECIKQEFDESSGYNDISTYFEHFAASQVLILILVTKKLIVVILVAVKMEDVITYIFF